MSGRISEIAAALLHKGFLTDAYAVPAMDHNSVVSFNCFPLWEGEKNGQEPVPVTFFLYVWPSEELALKYRPTDPRNHRYASSIHSHPMTCAFAVLQGTLVQKNYERARCELVERVVCLVDEELFQEGQGCIDDLNDAFIHQLCGRGTGSKPCISLHAYGRASAEQVLNCFRETRVEHSYNHVLQQDGTIQAI